MTNELTESTAHVLTLEHELIAQAMAATTGDIAKASRFDSVPHNAMSLRNIVRLNPEIRTRYNELLLEKLQEAGLHISERILKMVQLQDDAFGGEYVHTDIEGNEEVRTAPADPKMVIELSKEISRLILEGKGVHMSDKAAVLLTNREGAAEILEGFLNS